MLWDSEKQLDSVRAATLMSKILGEDVFILDDLTLTCRPDKIHLVRVLEVVRAEEYNESQDPA